MHSFAERPIRLIEEVKAESEALTNLDEICEKLCAFVVEGNDGRQLDESLCSRLLAETVWAVIAEATKLSLDENSLDEILPHCALSNAIVTAYKVYKDRLREQLSTVGWEYPHVVDIDWKIGGVLETSEGKESGTVAEIHFDTIATGTCDIERISFHCDVNQLQDLLWTFKEAQNSLHNLANS
ncbi:COMM domain-containing protein 3 [Toxocara canis]|uniref:COMM domain-containing protein 3 n=1 Tax=Toxocara canis TaxID=6265 RepID=A0A0B2VKW6_TOXCA|nr:COMM domain-containing protein 3 [Toxocara canis]